LVSLLLAALVAADLSDECLYVMGAYYFHSDKMPLAKKCFETYTVQQDVVDAIISNLELIKNVNPYVDIAKNPPSEPAGYFQAVDYDQKLAELKTTLASSGLIVSKVFRAIMEFIASFRDAHFSLVLKHPENEDYYNVFSPVKGYLPFQWEGGIEDGVKVAYVYNPHPSFLTDEAMAAISEYDGQGLYVKTIDGVNAYDFLANFFGKYDEMKTPQASLAHTRYLQQNGFSVLQYPIDNLFDNHTLLYSNGATVVFQYGFKNWEAPRRVTHGINSKKVVDVLKNFRKSLVKKAQSKIFCDSSNTMNHIRINSFNYEGTAATEFIQELTECVKSFDENENPISIILPHNSGGSFETMIATQIMLMPSSDFRVIGAMRKTDKTKHVAADSDFLRNFKFGNYSNSCDAFGTKSDIESFWQKTVTDDLGNSVSHERTDFISASFKDLINNVLQHALQKPRKPTDIIVATDGYCAATCAFFVDNVIRSGSAIVAGFGPTHIGDDSVAAAQCPSLYINPADYFSEVSNNAEYGIYFNTSIVESYDSSNLNNKIPGDYKFLSIDKHTGFPWDFDGSDSTTIGSFNYYLDQTHEAFKTTCNPANKRLLLVTDECTLDKRHATSFGYACGSNGEWDKTSCKVASCEQGYVVDFDNNRCVPNTCDPRYVPTSESSSSSSIPPPQSSSTPAPTSSSSNTPAPTSSSSNTPAPSSSTPAPTSSSSNTPAPSSSTPVPTSSSSSKPVQSSVSSIQPPQSSSVHSSSNTPIFQSSSAIVTPIMAVIFVVLAVLSLF